MHVSLRELRLAVQSEVLQQPSTDVVCFKVLMLIHFLQRRDPPVLPSLQVGS